MSVLNNPATLTMDALFGGGTVAWSTSSPYDTATLDNLIINAFYSCDYDNWPVELENRVKTILDAQMVHVKPTPHPFDDSILQIWIDFRKRSEPGYQSFGETVVLYVNKISQPGDTELASYVMNDILFTHSMTQSPQQVKREAGV